MKLIERLGEKYQVDELAAKYEFTGRTPMDVPKALEIKKELEAIDKLLKQIEEAAKTAQIGIIDLEELAQFAEPGDLEQLAQLQEQIQEYLKQMREQQGIEEGKRGFQMTPKAYRLFQSKLLTRIFEQMQASRSGRHQGPIVGEGATEMQKTRPYEFGDSVTHMDIPASFVNALLRSGPGLPVRLKTDDIVIHQTRNNPKCASAVLLDMSGSMGRGGMYINVKRMGLALDGLIRTEYPGDFLQFIELYTFAKPRHVSEVPALMPKPMTIYDYMVRLKADMSDPNVSEMQIPPHFTNIQHGLQTGAEVPRGSGHSQPPDHAHHRRSADGPLRGKWLISALPAGPADGERDAARGPALRPRGNHHQHLPAVQLEPERGGRAVRLPHGGVHEGPRLLHGWPRPGPLRRLGLHCPAEADYFVSVRKDDGS